MSMPANTDRRPRVARLAICLSLVAAACQATPSSPGPAISSLPAAPASSAGGAASPGSGCRIAASWNNAAEIFVEQSFAQGITDALQDPSIHYTEVDAKSSETEQIAEIDRLVDDGVDVLIVVPQSPDTIGPTLRRALARGVAVVVLERPVMDPDFLFIGRDYERTGELEARAVLAAKPSGTFVVINAGVSPESVLFRQGMTRAGLPEVGQSSKTLLNAGEVYTPWGDPATAKTEMEGFLQRNGNKVDMALVGDGLGGGVRAALTAQGVDGKVVLGGAGDDSWGLNWIAHGLQVVQVATDRHEMGKVAGEAALALCSNPSIEAVTTSAGKPAPFTAPGRLTIPAILVQPMVFDRSNLRVAIERQFGSAYYVCDNVPPGSVDGC
jgi:D-xylose transport system substrate-binding protein